MAPSAWWSRSRDEVKVRGSARGSAVWFPIGNNPRHPLDTLARFGEGLHLRQTAEKEGRDPATIGIAYDAGWFDATRTLTLGNGERR